MVLRSVQRCAVEGDAAVFRAALRRAALRADFRRLLSYSSFLRSIFGGSVGSAASLSGARRPVRAAVRRRDRTGQSFGHQSVGGPVKGSEWGSINSVDSATRARVALSYIICSSVTLDG